jgi:hypothetical protein
MGVITSPVLQNVPQNILKRKLNVTTMTKRNALKKDKHEAENYLRLQNDHVRSVHPLPVLYLADRKVDQTALEHSDPTFQIGQA